MPTITIPTFGGEVPRTTLRLLDNNQASVAILAVFDYEGEGESLHFSYDSFDQQNFSDTTNVATLALSGGEGLPTSVMWNVYRNYIPETGGELVLIILDPQAFLKLHISGEIAHKATQMEIGGKRKELIEKCDSVEEIQELLTEWDF